MWPPWRSWLATCRQRLAEHDERAGAVFVDVQANAHAERIQHGDVLGGCLFAVGYHAASFHEPMNASFASLSLVAPPPPQPVNAKHSVIAHATNAHTNSFLFMSLTPFLFDAPMANLRSLAEGVCPGHVGAAG